MAYTKQEWSNGSARAPLSAARLNHMEAGIAAAQGRIVLDPRDFDPGLLAGQTYETTYDSTPGIQAALNAAGAAGGGIVQLPYGVFKVTGLTIYNDTVLSGQGDNTVLLLTGGSNKNLIQSSSYGHATNADRGIVLRDFRMLGNNINQSPTLHPQAYLTADCTVGTDTIATVNSTTGFSSTGTLWLGSLAVSYTGKTSTTFTGISSAGAGAVRRGGWVTPVDSKGHLVALQGHRCRINNLRGELAAGSGIYIQAPYAGPYQAENIIENCRMEKCSRFAYEIGENASDGQASKLITGEDNIMGGLLTRGANWTIMDYHATGAFTTYVAVGPALLIAASDTRVVNFYPDTFPGTPVIIDCFVRGGQRVTDVQISKGRTFRCGLTGGSAVLFRGPTPTYGGVSRVNLDNLNMWSPFDSVIANGPITPLIGVHNLATASKIQVKSATDFQPSSAIGGKVNVSTDLLDYTGRQMSGAFSAGAVAGSTSLTVDSTAGFDPSGSIVVVTTSNAGQTYIVEVLTYTGKTATSFTGIPASSTGSITTDIVAGSTVSQHFLTGISGGSLTSVANSAGVFASAQTTVVSELQVVAPVFRSWQRGRFSMQTSDDYQLIGGVNSGKKMRSTGTASVTASTLTVNVTHNLAEAPTRVTLTPTADTQGRRYWVSAKGASTFTITLDANATTNPITFDWVAELNA